MEKRLLEVKNSILAVKTKSVPLTMLASILTKEKHLV